MLDYDLVTAKGRYRLPRRDDMPGLLRLAEACAAERSAPRQDFLDQILRTVQALSRRPDRGSLFLFEAKDELVGFCVLATGWSNAHGGEVLRIDELYIERQHRDQGLGEDFLRLLSQVAPPGTSAILLEVSPRDRQAAAFCAEEGFRSREEKIMVKRIAPEGA